MNHNSKIQIYFLSLCLFISIMGGYINNASAWNIITRSSSISDSLKIITHSFAKIKTSEGMVIYIDPYAVNEFADSADVVLITHEHSDHNELTRVKQKAGCVVIRSANATT